MKIPLFWLLIIATIVIFGIVFNVIAYAIPEASMAIVEVVLIAVSARFYLVYSYRSIVPPPRIAQHAMMRALIAAFIGLYCLILTFWNVWSLWNDRSLFLPRLSVPLVMVLYLLLQEHERTDIRKALQMNAHHL